MRSKSCRFYRGRMGAIWAQQAHVIPRGKRKAVAVNRGGGCWPFMRGSASNWIGRESIHRSKYARSSLRFTALAGKSFLVFLPFFPMREVFIGRHVCRRETFCDERDAHRHRFERHRIGFKCRWKERRMGKPHTAKRPCGVNRNGSDYQLSLKRGMRKGAAISRP
jgi:hypothetical protein